MNKKFLLIFCAVGLLLVTLPVLLLIRKTGISLDAQKGTITIAAGETKAFQDNQSTAQQTVSSQTGQTDEAGETPSFRVEFGVAEAPDFDDTAATDGNAEKSTQPSESTQPTRDQSTDGTLDATDGEKGMPDKLLTYEEFLALSNADQQAYFFCFDDPLDYAQWLRRAQQDYEAGKAEIVVTGPVDFGDLVP